MTTATISQEQNVALAREIGHKIVFAGNGLFNPSWDVWIPDGDDDRFFIYVSIDACGFETYLKDPETAITELAGRLRAFVKPRMRLRKRLLATAERLEGDCPDCGLSMIDCRCQQGEA